MVDPMISKMTLSIVFACCVFAAAPANAAQKNGRLRYDALACNNRQDAKKYFDLYVKHREAARRFETAHIAAKDCRMLQRSTEVIIHRNPWSGRSICVTPIGDAECLWVYRGWINRL